MSLINPRVWVELALVALIAAAGWFVYNWVYDRGADHVQRKWDAVEKERAEAALVAVQGVVTVTKDLQAKADKQRENQNAQIAVLNTSLGAAIAGLSNRPSRSGTGDVPSNPTTGAGCTPSQLYREDASVALGLAGEADKLRIDLQACYSAYEAARAALK